MRPDLHSIRILIPVSTIALLALSICIAYVVGSYVSHSHADSQAKINTGNKLSYLQGMAEQLIETGYADTLNQLVSRLGSEPDLLKVLIVDRDDKILASNNLRDRGSNWRSLTIRLDQRLINQARTGHQVILRHDHRTNVIEGYVSICAQTDSSAVRLDDCGFSYYRANLSYHYAASDRLLNLLSLYLLIGVSVTILFTFLLLHIFLYRPTSDIIRTLALFNGGDRRKRIKSKHRNEIGYIADAINAFLDTIVNNTKALEDNEKRLATIFNTCLDSIITIDPRGIVLSINPATTLLLGYSESDLLGKNISTIMPEPHRSRHDGYLANRLRGTGKGVVGTSRELKARTKSGSELPIALSVSEMRIDGELCFTGIIRDISDQLKIRQAMDDDNSALRNFNRLLEQKSRTDHLTGIANRAGFDEALEIEVRRTIRNESCLSLLMIDVDYFKLYNDFYGHTVGDRCLQRIAEAMRKSFQRAGEFPARYGGEEFAVILPGVDLRRALGQANRFCESIRELGIPHERSSVGDMVTVSVGLTTMRAVSKHVFSASKLVSAADESLYEAKESGRDRVVASVVSNEQLLGNV